MWDFVWLTSYTWQGKINWKWVYLWLSRVDVMLVRCPNTDWSFLGYEPSVLAYSMWLLCGIYGALVRRWRSEKQQLRVQEVWQLNRDRLVEPGFYSSKFTFNYPNTNRKVNKNEKKHRKCTPFNAWNVPAYQSETSNLALLWWAPMVSQIEWFNGNKTKIFFFAFQNDILKNKQIAINLISIEMLNANQRT